MSLPSRCDLRAIARAKLLNPGAAPVYRNRRDPPFPPRCSGVTRPPNRADQPRASSMARFRLMTVVLASGLAAAAPAHAQGGPPTVMVAAPLARSVAQWDEYTGRFEAVARVEVRPRVSGYIEGVHFTDGADVKEGDLLFTIDQRPFRL